MQRDGTLSADLLRGAWWTLQDIACGYIYLHASRSFCALCVFFLTPAVAWPRARRACDEFDGLGTCLMAGHQRGRREEDAEESIFGRPNV